LLPVPQLERCGNAQARDTLCLAAGQAASQFGHAFGDERKNARRRRVALRLMDFSANAADKIDQDQVGPPTADLETQGKYAVRLQREGDRRLADTAALGTFADHQAVALERAHDHADRLRRQARLPGNLSLGQAAVAAYLRKNQAFVIETHTD